MIIGGKKNDQSASVEDTLLLSSSKVSIESA